MQPIELLYIAIALIYFFFGLYKAENKLLMGMIIFWFFADPILGNPKYMLRIEAADINIQVNRIVLIPLLVMIVIVLIKIRKTRIYVGQKSTNNNQPIAYEKWMALYAITSLISLVINYDQVGLRHLMIVIWDILVFIFFYYVVKYSITNNDMLLLLRSMLIFATLSAIIGIAQFFFNPELLRVGSLRVAFGNYFRGNGLFKDEFTQGFFQILALSIFFSFKNQLGLLKNLFFLLSSTAVFLTMHRLSWIAWFVALGIFGYNKLKTGKINPIKITLGLLFLLILFLMGADPFLKSGIYETFDERVKQDTLTVRTDYYKLSVDIIRNNPFGLGGYRTDNYYQFVSNAGLSFYGVGPRQLLAVHNGFLSAGVKYGLPGLVTFMLFIFGVIYFYFIKFRKERSKYLSPFCLSVLIFIYNTTNDFSDVGSQLTVIYAILLGCFASYTFLNSDNKKNRR